MQNKQDTPPFQPLKAALLLSIPLMVYAVIMMGDEYVPPILNKLQIPAAILLLSFIFSLIWRGRLHRKGVGTIPPGFSAELDVLEAQLRARAVELEEAFQQRITAPPLASGLVMIMESVERTARNLDKKEFSYLKVVRSRDEEIQAGLKSAFGSDAGGDREIPPSLENDLRWFSSTVESASNELKSYAAEVRAKGGLYKIKLSELKGCSIQLLLFSAAGGVLIWKYYAVRDWHFWTGVALAVCVVLEILILLGMHFEPA